MKRLDREDLILANSIAEAILDVADSDRQNNILLHIHRVILEYRELEKTGRFLVRAQDNLN